MTLVEARTQFCRPHHRGVRRADPEVGLCRVHLLRRDMQVIRSSSQVGHRVGDVDLEVGCRGVVQLGGLVLGLGLTKVKARKSILFNKSSLEVLNKEHLVDLSHYFLSNRIIC